MFQLVATMYEARQVTKSRREWRNQKRREVEEMPPYANSLPGLGQLPEIRSVNFSNNLQS